MPLTVYFLNSEHQSEIQSLTDFLRVRNSLHLFPNEVVLLGVSADTFQHTLRCNSVACDAIASNRLLPSSSPERWIVLTVSTESMHYYV